VTIVPPPALTPVLMLTFFFMVFSLLKWVGLAAGQDDLAAVARFDTSLDADVCSHGVLLGKWVGLAAGQDVLAALARFDTSLDADVFHGMPPCGIWCN
jgi:hypothetical protein